MTQENEERLRRDTTEKLAEEHVRGVRVEAVTRAVQTALDIEAGERKAQEARVAGLEMGLLSWMKARWRKEQNDLVSVIFQGDEEGLLLAQQEEQPGMFAKERLALQKMQLRQMERKMGGIKTWGAMHRVLNDRLREKVHGEQQHPHQSFRFLIFP